jgi:hypothetical protein
MKQNVHHLYYLFYPRGWILTVLLLISTTVLAQESTTDEFTVGSPIKNKLIDFPNLIDTFNTVGLNTIWQRADSYTQDRLEQYNLIALNEYDSTEYIFHYSTAYYSKWEAEQNLTGEDTARVGFKHKGGQPAFWYDPELDDTVLCWSTQGLSAPACSLMYGPHYRQEKRYKRWHYGCRIGEGCVTYTPRFRMALDNHGDADSTEDVCKIKVVFRYKDLADSLHHETTFIERTLKVGDFDTTGAFDDFYLHPNPTEGRYEYWPNFILPDKFMQSVDSPLPADYTDWESFTGIQFWVEWQREDTLCNLYIDYAEVYDNKGWNDFIRDPEGTADLIKYYADSFKTMGWDNIIYWTGPDEPFTIDSYMPMHIVDSLIRSDPVNAPPLVVHFDPNWTWDHKINGEDEIEMFYNIAKPEKNLLNYLPEDLLRRKYLKFEYLK